MGNVESANGSSLAYKDIPKALNGGESAAVGSVTAISPFSKRVRLLCMLFGC